MSNWTDKMKAAAARGDKDAKKALAGIACADLNRRLDRLERSSKQDSGARVRDEFIAAGERDRAKARDAEVDAKMGLAPVPTARPSLREGISAGITAEQARKLRRR